MPISLYDGDAYIVNKESIERKGALSFFLSGHTKDYLLLYNEYDQYDGVITYKSLLQSIDLETAVICEKLYIGDSLWDDARRLLCDNKTLDAIPVFNQDMEICYFAKYDKRIADAWGKLCILEEYVDKAMWKTFQCHTDKVHIRGINDVLFRLRKWLVSMEIEVSVEGEEWGLWGIESTLYTEDRILVGQGCQWIDLVYDECLNWLEPYEAQLKKMLCKAYKQETDKKKRVIFYLSNYPYYVESIECLILRYIRQDIECICAFPSIAGIVRLGCKNIASMIGVIEELEGVGAKCHVACEEGLLNNEYDLCFFLSDDLGRVPLTLRAVSKRVVALQETPLYPHMYVTKGLFEEVFSEQGRQETDYLVVSDYMADWICERKKEWEEKILRFGYPKLDKLYSALHSKQDIPEQWIDRTLGKTVYLFTTYRMEQAWLDLFKDKEDNKIAIWRLHPLTLGKTQEKKMVEDICEKYNIIIDDLPSYYASFHISNALIAPVTGSLMINYLCTGKPMCLYEKGVYKLAEMDYQKESWYKSADSALNEKDVLEFINKIEKGELIISEEQRVNRKNVTSNFDGKVCDRIYEYFEEKE